MGYFNCVIMSDDLNVRPVLTSIAYNIFINTGKGFLSWSNDDDNNEGALLSVIS